MANLRDKLRGDPPPGPKKAKQASRSAKSGKSLKASKNVPPVSLKALKGLDVNRKLLLASVAIAMLAGSIAVTYLSDAKSNLLDFGQKVKVYVATQTVPARQQLTSDMVHLTELPKGILPEGYLSDEKDVVGKITYAPVAKGEILHKLRVGDATADTGVSPKLMANERGFIFTIDEANGVALVKPDDHVDLAATLQTPTGYLSTKVVQHVRVMSIGNRMSPADAPDAYSNLLTLAVPSDKVALLTALKQQGNLSVSLREPGDTSVSPPEVSEADLARYVLGHVPRPEAPRPVVVVHAAAPRPVIVRPRPRPVVVHPPAPQHGGVDIYNGTQLIHKKQ